jgi:hypothetical protein
MINNNDYYKNKYLKYKYKYNNLKIKNNEGGGCWVFNLLKQEI